MVAQRNVAITAKNGMRHFRQMLAGLPASRFFE
jgi:hypothetical protein